MSIKESEGELEINVGPIEKALHSVENAIQDVEDQVSHATPMGIFCAIGLMGLLILVYRLISG